MLSAIPDTDSRLYAITPQRANHASYQAYLQNGTHLDRLIEQEEGYTAPRTDPAFIRQPRKPLNCTEFAQQHTEQFLEMLEPLEPEYRDLLCEYHLLEKKETFLARIHSKPQTTISSEIRNQGRLMLTQLILGAHPTAQTIQPLLERAGIQSPRLADILVTYSETRSYKQTAKRFHLHTPAVRSMFGKLARRLNRYNDLEIEALGCWVEQLVYRSIKFKQTRQNQTVRLRDPQELGAFDVDVNQPGFDHLFVSQADPNKS